MGHVNSLLCHLAQFDFLDHQQDGYRERWWWYIPLISSAVVPQMCDFCHYKSFWWLNVLPLLGYSVILVEIWSCKEECIGECCLGFFLFSQEQQTKMSSTSNSVLNQNTDTYRNSLPLIELVCSLPARRKFQVLAMILRFMRNLKMSVDNSMRHSDIPPGKRATYLFRRLPPFLTFLPNFSH